MASVSEFILDRLHEWGIRQVYGFPGDGINGLLGAWESRKDKVRFIQTRHEEMAAFMASAHSKWTGEVGVCTATSGPGAIHLLNGLYDAKMDNQSVLAIVGQSPRQVLGGFYQQEVDLISLFKDVANEYVHMLVDPRQTRHLVDEAMRIAKARRTVTCIILPGDIQEEEFEEPPHKHGTVHSGIGYDRPIVVPSPFDLKRAADILNQGSKVAMLVGAGSLHATDEIVATADALGAGVAKALLGRAAVPDDLPFVTGPIGLLGTKPSWDMMMDCDTLLMVGTNFPYGEFLPKEGQAKAVQIDIEARHLGLRYPTSVNLQGDSAATLRALLPMLERKTDRGWRDTIEGNVRDWWSLVGKRAESPANPINPEKVFWELSKHLPDNCIIAADSGTSADWFARDLRLRRGMMASLSGNLATMGPGVPYAIAAKFTHPGRVAIAVVGDGAMQMNGINGLITIAKYWREWQDPRLVVLVLHNNDLNQVTWEQRVLVGDPKFPVSQDIPSFPFAQYAEMLGLRGVKVEQPDQIDGAWKAAFSADRPCVVEALTDPDVPPLPPHISFDQAKHFATSVVRGDPDRVGMVKESLRDMIEAPLRRD